MTPTLQKTVSKAVEIAQDHSHEYVTLEHLLLALLDDSDAKLVLTRCGLDFTKFREELETLLDDFEAMEGDEPMPTAAFHRTLQRAILAMRSAGRDEANGANVLVSLFDERQSRAHHLLEAFGLSRLDITTAISRGSAPTGIDDGSSNAPMEGGPQSARGLLPEFDGTSPEGRTRPIDWSRGGTRACGAGALEASKKQSTVGG
jgi:ATP-dependent Clp protease ATP-binding subunit ClpA